MKAYNEIENEIYQRCEEYRKEVAAKIKAHTDLKSRELHVRKLERELSQKIIDCSIVESINGFKLMINDNEIIKNEWNTFLSTIKIFADIEYQSIITKIKEYIDATN